MRMRVTVFKQKGRPHLVAEWRDPLTGKLKRKSTGEKVRREAERFAARLEKELNEGRQADYRTTWPEFRDRYESEVAAFKSKGTQTKVQGTFNAVEKHIGPKYLRAVDTSAISKFSAKLREIGNAEASVASTLRTLKAALRWAARLKLIPEAPHITMPPKAAEKAGGRAVTEEEFERMLSAVPKVLETEGRVAEVARRRRSRYGVTPAAIESWRFLLRGLWWSGLRIREAYRLHWTDDRELVIDLSGKRPMFRIRSQTDKGRKDRRFPLVKEFADILEGDRDGYVFNPLSISGRRAGFDWTVRIVAAIGEAAGIVVDRNEAGEPVYASAHDLRRSFGTRWAKRVMPPVLKLLMRHSSIVTTLNFYVDQNADEAANEAWAASEKAEKAQSPIISPITGPVAKPANRHK